MEKKTITLSKKAFDILDGLVCNELADQAVEIAFEDFNTPEEAEENARAYKEIFKAFNYEDDRFNKAVILKQYGSYLAEWEEYYDEEEEDDSVELIKEITL